MKSIAGSYLDPIADKVLVMSVYLTLGSLSLIPGQPYPLTNPPAGCHPE
jgi:phosphatidylglycerophosphate synthase